jgi:hypothetical protein
MNLRLVVLAVLMLGCSLSETCNGPCHGGDVGTFWINVQGQCPNEHPAIANVEVLCDTPPVPVSTVCDYPIYYKAEGPNQCRVTIACSDGSTESLVVDWTSECAEPQAVLADGGVVNGSWSACEGSSDNDAAADAPFDAGGE